MPRIRFYVEDEHEQKGLFDIDIGFNWPFSRFKEAVQKKYQLPTEFQRWIICNKLVSDDTISVKKLGLINQKEPIFVYLVHPESSSSAKSVPDKQDVVPDDALQSAKWKCSICTLINNEEMKNCVACFSLNPNSKKEDYTATYDKYSNDGHETEQFVDPLQFWECRRCTLNNSVEMKNCVACLTLNPVYETDQFNAKHYLDLVELDDTDLILNPSPFQCSLCFSVIKPGKGAVLLDCLHQFCIRCLSRLIKTCTDPEVKCPYNDEDYACDSVLQDREIKSLVSAEEYDSFLKKSLNIAEAVVPNSFHCMTTGCSGWCIVEDDASVFECPICNQVNCLPCRAIHFDSDCKQYQDYLFHHSPFDAVARNKYGILKRLEREGKAVRCQQCKVIIVKNEGCDYMSCSVCERRFSWAPRS